MVTTETLEGTINRAVSYHYELPTACSICAWSYVLMRPFLAKKALMASLNFATRARETYWA
jgi:hypothetical protein